MTRIQDEWDRREGDSSDHERAGNDFIFKAEFLKVMKDECYLLHPLPKRDEIEEEVDYLGDHRVVYWRQERNGMWMRVVIIANVFGVDAQIFAASAKVPD